MCEKTMFSTFAVFLLVYVGSTAVCWISVAQ